MSRFATPAAIAGDMRSVLSLGGRVFAIAFKLFLFLAGGGCA
jgi:hypothetical protein